MPPCSSCTTTTRTWPWRAARWRYALARGQGWAAHRRRLGAQLFVGARRRHGQKTAAAWHLPAAAWQRAGQRVVAGAGAPSPCAWASRCASTSTRRQPTRRRHARCAGEAGVDTTWTTPRRFVRLPPIATVLLPAQPPAAGAGGAGATERHTDRGRHAGECTASASTTRLSAGCWNLSCVASSRATAGEEADARPTQPLAPTPRACPRRSR